MTPSQAAEVEAKKTFEGFIKWVKVSFYWIMAILVILAWCNFGADTETGSQYNGEVYAPTNIGKVMIEVTYVDHMGSDLSVVNAARVSFGKKSDWMPRVHNGEQLVLTPKDAKLVSYLARHQHKSPFNHAFATFHIKAPIFVARQLQKHEYMPWNEISRRYVDNEPEFYQPDVWRGRSEDKKQGSDGVVDVNMSSYKSRMLDLVKHYSKLVDMGVAPEQARMVLPQSMMTEWYWSGSLYAFAKMCGLRLKPDAQYETRLVAEQIEDKMTELFPESWTALRAYDDT